LPGKHGSPVLPHIHDDPALIRSDVENFIQRADVALAVVGILAICISVVNEQSQAATFSGHRVLGSSACHCPSYRRQGSGDGRCARRYPPACPPCR